MNIRLCIVLSVSMLAFSGCSHSIIGCKGGACKPLVKSYTGKKKTTNPMNKPRPPVRKKSYPVACGKNGKPLSYTVAYEKAYRAGAAYVDPHYEHVIYQNDLVDVCTPGAKRYLNHKPASSPVPIKTTPVIKKPAINDYYVPEIKAMKPKLTDTQKEQLNTVALVQAYLKFCKGDEMSTEDKKMVKEQGGSLGIPVFLMKKCSPSDAIADELTVIKKT